jgi:fructose-1,6-bisphosphatase/inositol monophosphatase family enzyme
VAPGTYFPRAVRDRVATGTERLGAVLPGSHCAAREYRDILTGDQHFAMFWKTMPWDHAPGTALLREAGGVVRRLDGRPYEPTERGEGLLAAANEAIWETVHEVLVG